MHLNLRVKLMLGVLTPLALALGVFAFLQYSSHREQELALAAQTAADLGRVIEGSLAEAMLAQDLPAIQKIINNISANAHVQNMVLINRYSEVRATPGGRDVGRVLSTADEGCRVCHDQEGSGEIPYTAVIDLPGAGRILRNCNPIENRPACHACHDPDTRYNGVLITDISLADMDHRLKADLQRTLFSLGGALLFGALMFGVILNPLVVRRVERLTALVQALDRGDLAERAKIDSSDELGVLAKAFNRMADGLEERNRLQMQVRQRTEELERLNNELREKEAVRARLLKQVIQAQEAERKRIARELHDEMAQSLTGLIMSLDSTEGVIGPELRNVHEQLARTREISVRALQQTRHLILDLRPTMLDDLGLVPAIRWYAETRLGAGGAAVVFQTKGSQRRLQPELETAVFRIAQEAINNVAKHAHADNVQVRLHWEPYQVILEVQDDGKGFNVDDTYREHELGQGMGLLGMRERAEMFGGEIEIASCPGEGTLVRVTLPTA
jgi:signal transduction histidine kinase